MFLVALPVCRLHQVYPKIVVTGVMHEANLHTFLITLEAMERRLYFNA